jgi:hypothetical protein
MATRIWVPISVAVALFCGTAGARAQSVGPDEAVKPDGAVGAPLALTAAQRSAIYNAVMGERVRPTAKVRAAVGEPVSPTAALAELPNGAAADNSPVTDLKYALVDGDVVVVDPVGMRVVDVIRGSVGR